MRRLIWTLTAAAAAGVALIGHWETDSRPVAPVAAAQPAPAGVPWTVVILWVVVGVALGAAGVLAWRRVAGRQRPGRIVAPTVPPAPQRAIEGGPVPLSEAIPGWRR